MARYTGPKFRLDRREGTNLLLKGSRSTNGKHPIDKKGVVPPGQHGLKKTFARKQSNYGMQLREKQKVKRMYGVLEKQFRKYFSQASKKREATGEALLHLLETRLDNVVYKLGFAFSRAQARQLTNHGHIFVNGKKVDIPSFNVRIDDVVSLSKKGANFEFVNEALKETSADKLPKWLERKGNIGKLARLPAREELAANINEQAIVEFYSR